MSCVEQVLDGHFHVAAVQILQFLNLPKPESAGQECCDSWSGLRWHLEV
jgi:hypothetical protein